MKKIKITTITLIGLSLGIASCDTLTDVAQTATDVLTTTEGGEKSAPALTNDEVIAGLKEALTIGIQNGASKASAVDGFLNNPKIRLPFPEEALVVKEKALELGLDGQVEKFELTMNRAAEEASKTAAPIFIDAIKNMSIQDGFTILRGGDSAATQYLREHTTEQLIVAFTPKVQEATEKVQLTKYWNPLTSTYNKTTFLTGKPKVNTDLNKYITDRAIDGLFTLVQEEEVKIRKDPMARVTDILQKVFGSLGGN